MARAGFKKGAKMERFEKALRNPSKALKQIGMVMVAESQESFRLQKFGKSRWRKRKVPNVFGIVADMAQGRGEIPARRFDDRPALRDTGRLASSISYRVTGKTVIVGSNLPYAAAHQHGGRVESEQITKEVQTKIADYLKNDGKQWEHALAFLLLPQMLGERLSMKVPRRPFLGITKQTIEDVREIVGVEIFEAR